MVISSIIILPKVSHIKLVSLIKGHMGIKLMAIKVHTVIKVDQVVKVARQAISRTEIHSRVAVVLIEIEQRLRISLLHKMQEQVGQ